MPNLSLIGTQSLVPSAGNIDSAGLPGGREFLSAAGSLGGAVASAYEQHQSDKARIWAGTAASNFHLQQLQAVQAQHQDAVNGIGTPGAPAPDANPGGTMGVMGATASAPTPLTPVPDMVGNFLKGYDDNAAQLLKSAPNAMARKYIQGQLTSSRESLAGQVLGQQVQLERQWKMATATTGVDNGGKIVQQDPSQYDAQMGNIVATMPHIDPVTDAAHLVRAKESLTNAAASSTLDRDPYALKALTGKALGEVDPSTGKAFSGPTGTGWVDQATPDQVKTWNSLADAKIRMLESRQKTDQDAAEAYALKSYNELVTFTNTGKVPDLDYIARVKSATKGTSQEQSASAMLQVAVSGGGFGSMALPRQAATLTQLEANGNAAGTDPQREATLQQFRTINTTQKKAYADNPWDASTQFAHLPAQPEQQITAPEQGIALIQARKPFMPAVENASGVAAAHGGVSPLQPNEAAAWGSTLASLSISNRADVLGRAGAGLTAPQIDALADQLGGKDKATALMLKINDRTVSGRQIAELVAYGAQGLQDKTVQADDTKLSGWRADIANQVRGSLGNAKAEQDIIDAAYYVRAAGELPSATSPGYSPTKTNEGAIALVAGLPITRGGVNTLLPRGMTESDFDAKLRGFTPEALQAQAPDGKVYIRDQGGVREIPLLNLHNRMVDFGMKYYAPGVYAPVRNNSIITTDKDGTKPLLLKVQ